MNDVNLGTKSTRKKRAAKTPKQKIEELEQQQAQIKAKIQKERSKLSAEKRKKDTRRKIVAGAIALEHMEHDANFAEVMKGLLKRHVKETDQALFEI